MSRGPKVLPAQPVPPAQLVRRGHLALQVQLAPQEPWDKQVQRICMILPLPFALFARIAQRQLAPRNAVRKKRRCSLIAVPVEIRRSIQTSVPRLVAPGRQPIIHS